MSVHDGSEFLESGSTFSTPRPFRWSLRREIWENRFVYMAPLIFSAFAVFGFCMSMIGMAGRRRAVRSPTSAACARARSTARTAASSSSMHTRSRTITACTSG